MTRRILLGLAALVFAMPMTGAAQALFAEQLKQGGTNTVTTGETLDGGKIAVATGGWVATGADGKHLDHGSYVTVYKKVGSTWMIYLDTWNSSM
jgi:hypothetical protein